MRPFKRVRLPLARLCRGGDDGPGFDWRRLETTAWICFDTALELVYPCRCPGCGVLGSPICSACFAGIQLMRPPLCPHCGRSMPVATRCGQCRAQPAVLRGVRTAAPYGGLVREAIHRLKYSNERAFAIPLAALLLECCRREGLAADLVVPVPLHPRRLRARGYNQAALLARRLARSAGLELDRQSLVRSVDTASQVGLGLRERAENMREAFSCSASSVSGKRILLVDDVYTTGATIHACARALRLAGAREVWAVAVARDEPGDIIRPEA